MKKLLILVGILSVIFCLDSCKNSEKEEKVEISAEAQKILESKTALCDLLEAATKDNVISDEEANKINEATNKFQMLDAEIKTSFIDNDSAQDKYFKDVKNKDLENRYGEALKNAAVSEGGEKIDQRVR